MKTKIERFGIGFKKDVPKQLLNTAINGILQKLREEIHKEYNNFNNQPIDDSILVIEVYQVYEAKIKVEINEE